ncbi:MAG TPA: histone H1 [Thermoanaerobaculia bacterium]|jgi:hypothetical protein|nr:histone H1 [Thermoanaerobaculia bacterium]
MTKRPARPRDPNLLARDVFMELVGERPKTAPPEPVSAREASRRGGKKGGKARADAMTAEQRSEAAKKAASARWKK